MWYNACLLVGTKTVFPTKVYVLEIFVIEIIKRTIPDESVVLHVSGVKIILSVPKSEVTLLDEVLLGDVTGGQISDPVH